MQQDKASTVFIPKGNGRGGAGPGAWNGGEGKGSKGKGKGKGKVLYPETGNAHFGHFGAEQGQFLGQGAPPGDFGGGNGGWVNGMGPFVPPYQATQQGGQGPSIWRGAGKQRRQREAKAAKDAACAAELAADAESEVSAAETPGSAKYFAAARHLTRVAEGQSRVCPEAAERCKAQAQQYLQRGQNLMPLSQQVATLEKQYRAKVAEAERLSGQVRSAQTLLDQAVKQGAEVKRQLHLAKAKVVAAPPSALASSAPPDMAGAMHFFLQASSILPPEQACMFGTFLETIQRAMLGDPLPVTPTPMELGTAPSGGRPATDPTDLSVPTGPEEEFPADWVARQHAEADALEAAASTAVNPPRALPPAPRGSSPSRLCRGSASSATGGHGRSRSQSFHRTHAQQSAADAFISDGKHIFLTTPRERGWTIFSPALLSRRRE